MSARNSVMSTFNAPSKPWRKKKDRADGGTVPLGTKIPKGAEEMGVSINKGKKIAQIWLISGYPYFRKPSNGNDEYPNLGTIIAKQLLQR